MKKHELTEQERKMLRAFGEPETIKALNKMKARLREHAKNYRGQLES